MQTNLTWMKISNECSRSRRKWALKLKSKVSLSTLTSCFCLIVLIIHIWTVCVQMTVKDDKLIRIWGATTVWITYNRNRPFVLDNNLRWKLYELLRGKQHCWKKCIQHKYKQSIKQEIYRKEGTCACIMQNQSVNRLNSIERHIWQRGVIH